MGIKENIKEIPLGMVELFDLLDPKIDEVISKAPASGFTVGCHECSEAYCCMQTTVVFPAEAILIASKYPVPAERWEDFLLADKAMRSMSREDYFEAGTRCVYQTDDNMCAVYDARPMCCRRYFVACPPEKCSPSWRDKVPVLNLSWLDGTYLEIMIGLNAMLELYKPVFGTLPFMAVMATRLLASGDPAKLLANTKWIDIDSPWSV